MKNIRLLIIFACIASCTSSKKVNDSSSSANSKYEDQEFVLREISTDKTYGLSSKNPVMVGGNKSQSGPLNERRYLNLLAGPNGEAISYHRAGSCCPMKSENGFSGYAMLDNYRVTWEGSTDTVSIFINMYDAGELKAPVGFTIKQ